MVSLKLNERTYKVIGTELILSIVLVCVMLYGGNRLLAHISHVNPVTSSPLDANWGLLQVIFMGLSALLGVISLVLVILLVVRLFMMVCGYSKHHFILDETGISLQTPLDFNHHYYEYPQIRAINIESKKNGAVRVLLNVETTYFMLGVTKKEIVSRGSYITGSELTLLKNYLNKIEAGIPITSINR